MTQDQRFGQPTQGSQTGADTDGRSPEYRDNLTIQDETAAAGSSGIVTPAPDYADTATGIRPAGTGESDASWTRGGGAETDLTTGRDYGSTSGGVSDETVRGGASQGAQARHAFGDNTDGLGRDRTAQVTADETGTLISADKVQGTAVYDAAGERLGTIDSLMLNKRSGKVAYAVMSFGGFLGIGERYHPLPWDKLTYDVDKGGYNIGATTDELRAGPTYSRDELDQFESGGRDDEVDDYYGRAATQSSTMPSSGIGGSSAGSY